MPIYEYKCHICEKEIEIVQSLNDPPPECCGQPMEKEVSISSFQLKGKGWDKDNYSSANEKKK
jgi:putative FmdB family regulatory protein